MVGVREIAEIRERVIATSCAIEPELLMVPDAQRMLADVTAVKNAAATMEALLAKRIADAGEWQRAGDRSAEDHLAKTTGTTVGRARETLATAGRLGGLGATADAARAGALSPEQAAAVSDAAIANPGAEQTLLATAARGSLQDLHEACAKVKAAADPDPDATYRRRRAERSLRIWADRNGVAKLFGVTTPDQMATIKAAVERRTTELFNAARRTGQHEPRGAYMMDALSQICAEWLGEPSSSAGAEAEAAPEAPGGSHPDAPQPRRRRRSQTPRFLGIVRADLEALRRGSVEADEVCEINGLGPVPVSVAQQLLGESVLHLVLTKGTAVGTTVNLKRGPNTAQRIALLATQPTCRITACNSPFTEIDHDDPWAHCKTTELAKLQRCCTHHHDLKTQGWAILEAGGIVSMVAPDDPRHPRNGQAPPRRPGP